MTISPDKLVEIFHSGYPGSINWYAIDDIAAAIHRGILVYDSEPIVSVDAYRHAMESVTVSEGLGPQERGHMALKACAARWCATVLGVSVLFESHYVGLHPDVRTVDGAHILECGTTDPSCVSIYLDYEPVEWVGNIAYPYADESNIVMHRFRRGEGYRAWRAEQTDRLRSVFQKRHI